jgi:hypothetical protein
VQDQLQSMRRLLAFQQAETKRVSEQMSGLTLAVEGLRQSFASAQSESAAPAARSRPVRMRLHATTSAQSKRTKSPG